MAAAGVVLRPPVLRAVPQAPDGQLPSAYVLYYGVDAPPPRSIELAAGPMTMVFEPELAFLRHIKLGSREILRGIYAPVRDRNWGTVAPRLSNLKVETSDAGFRVSFDVDCKEPPIDFVWKGVITGDQSGTVRFTFDGEARSTFLRNRIGFCVLHPIAECAGQPCTVEKVNGAKEQGRFPDNISPNQPFVDMRAISHTVEPGITAEIRMEGDIFEMEDQRNWIDASYKTYCTPLSLPYPAEVKTGSRISQAVSLKLSATPKAASVRPLPPEILVAVGSSSQAARLPAIGLGIANDSPELSARERDRLKLLRPAHLRVDLKLSNSGYRALLKRAASEAASVGASLEAAVFVTDSAEDELRGLTKELDSIKPKIARWLVFHEKELSTTDKWVSLARKHLAGVLGTGTNANFTELNRGRPKVEGVDIVCYSANPQVHAFDNVSLAETFEGLRHTIRSARQFTGPAKLAITQVTLKQRFNPVATAAETTSADRLPSPVDPRQMSLFGAGWTLGSMQAIAESRVEFATYYETTGWRGVMETEQGSRMPAKFPSKAGAVFPLYHVLADIADFAGGEVVPTDSKAPLKIAAMTLRKSSTSRVLVANLTDKGQSVRIENAGLGRSIRVRRLDEHSYGEASASPEAYRKNAVQQVRCRSSAIELGLLPYEYVCADPA